MFGIRDVYASILSIPTIFAMGFSFMYCSGKILYFGSQSKIFPTQCAYRRASNGSALISFAISAIMGFLVCLLIHFVKRWNLRYLLTNCALLCSYSVYLIQCIGYVYLQQKFENLPRSYLSPTGRIGAVISIVVWILCGISIVVFQKDDSAAIVIFCIYGALLSALYFGFVRHYQTVSKTEGKILFKVHVVNCKQCRFLLFFVVIASWSVPFNLMFFLIK
jgi:amino acid transporter